MESFLDSFAPDREDGLRNHKFVEAEIEEEKKDEEDPAQRLCLICGETRAKHASWATCKVCYEV